MQHLFICDLFYNSLSILSHGLQDQTINLIWVMAKKLKDFLLYLLC